MNEHGNVLENLADKQGGLTPPLAISRTDQQYLVPSVQEVLHTSTVSHND